MLRLAQRLIDLADGDPVMGNLLFGSPSMYAIMMRGIARASLGMTGWKRDLAEATAASGRFDTMTRTSVLFFTYISGVAFGFLQPDAAMLGDTGEAHEFAKQAGEDLAVGLSESARAVVSISRDTADRAGHGRAGGNTVDARRGQRPRGCAGRDRPIERRAHRPRVCAERNHRASVADVIGPSARRRRRLPGAPRSLSGDGDLARLHGAHRHRRGHDVG